MSIAALAIIVALASFAVLAPVLSAAVWLLVRRKAESSARRNARVLFLRAVGPTAVAGLVAVGLLLPSFLMYEVQRVPERPGLMLVALAVAGAIRLVWIGARGIRTMLASRALVRAWRSGAVALPREPWGMRGSTVDAGFPMVAVAGLFRPHVFVDRSVVDACSPAELAAVAAHERAHVATHDNLKRLLIAACAGHQSEAASAWRIAAEHAADERASVSPRAATDLASALVRVARMAPAPLLPIAAISTIHDGGSLELRVRRLLAVGPANSKLSPRAWPAVVGVTATVTGLMLATPLPQALHGVLELLVQRLP